MAGFNWQLQTSPKGLNIPGSCVCLHHRHLKPRTLQRGDLATPQSVPSKEKKMETLSLAIDIWFSTINCMHHYSWVWNSPLISKKVQQQNWIQARHLTHLELMWDITGANWRTNAVNRGGLGTWLKRPLFCGIRRWSTTIQRTVIETFSSMR